MLSLLIWAAWAEEPACGSLKALPETLQVAWVSPLQRRAGAATSIPVVRTSDLRGLVQARKRDMASVLQALGLIGRKGKVKKRYKITLFDVKREWLCRPYAAPADSTQEGLSVCTMEERKPAGVRGRAWSDCGFLQDVATGDRTLDVYRVDWATAATWGFCVMPLERFLEGA